MKIIAVESWITRIPLDSGAEASISRGVDWTTLDTLWVRVVTDQGIEGWGEAFGHTCCPATRVVIDTQVTPLLLGRDARDIRGIHERLTHALMVFGLAGPHVYAISAVDIALWDLAGKAANLPLHRLLGAAPTATRPVYASLPRYPDAPTVARICRTAIELGYGDIKLHEHDVRHIEAARAATGPDIRLSTDVNCHWSIAEALAIIPRLRDSDLAWLEEPIWPPDDAQGLARVRREGKMPVSAGENAVGRQGFRAMLEAGAIDIAQPSVIKIGGITTMLDIAAMAKAAGVQLIPHSAYFGPGWLASIHLNVAFPAAPIERKYGNLEASPYHELVCAQDGQVPVPDGPGLGRDPDMQLLRRYADGAPTIVRQ